MIHLQDRQDTPNLEEIGEYIRNPCVWKLLSKRTNFNTK